MGMSSLELGHLDDCFISWSTGKLPMSREVLILKIFELDVLILPFDPQAPIRSGLYVANSRF